MKLRPLVVVLIASLLVWGSPPTANAAVSISRAELSGGELRLEGDRAVPEARILVDGVDRGRADDRGRFKIRVSGFSSPTCRISVDDGTSPVETSLSGCTPSSPSEPDPPDEPPDEGSPTASGLLLSPSNVEAGATSTATVLLSGPAPTGGTTVTLESSDPSVATIATSLTIASGDTAGSATVTTQSVSTESTATISATAGGVTRTATVTVAPAPGHDPPEPSPAVASFLLDPSTVASNETSTGTVLLNAAAPSGGATVTLVSNNPFVASVPSSVTVPAGATTATFTATAQPVSSTLTAIISASAGGATRSALLTVTPPPPDPDPDEPPTVAGLDVAPASVTSDQTATGTVSLSAPAPTGGTAVSLVSNDTSVAAVPSSVTVAGGASTATFTVTAQPVSSTSVVTISASAGGITRSATLTVSPAGIALDTLGVSPTLVLGGQGSVGTVTLTGAAPTGGAAVTLSSSNTDRATVPATVTVPAGATTATFEVSTLPNDGPARSVSITASYGGVSRFASLTVDRTPGVLSALTIDPNTVIGGETSQGTVVLSAAQSSNVTVLLSSTDTTVASVPQSVTVPAGQTSSSFTIVTHPVSGSGTFSWISGTFDGVERGASINVNPGAPPGAPTIATVTFAPAQVGGGGAATGTVTLSGAANDGAVIDLASSHPGLVQVPAEVVVAPGQSNVHFPVTTSTVSANTEVAVTATARCCGATGSRDGTVTVTTDAPAPPDEVEITRARLRRCILEVEATSTNPNAIVSVHTQSGAFLMRLTNLGNGQYAGERAWRPPGTNVPVTLVVSSNFGGFDTVTVTDPQAGRCRADL